MRAHSTTVDPCDILFVPDGVLGAGEAMRRREFIVFVGSTAAAWPLAARAQQAVMPVVGFLGSRSPEDSKNLVAAFRSGLGETGFVEGCNAAIEFRWAEGHYERLPALSADLVARKVSVIAAPGGIAAGLAAKAATTEIPIIFLTGADPVQFGFVRNFSRPDGNLTGVAILTNTLAPKQLELLHEVAPSAKYVAFLVNPKNPIAESDTRDLESAANATGQQIIVFNTSTEGDIGRGLMSYGTVLADAYRQVGVYAGKILNGTKPSDLPVQQSVRVELILNLRAARALGRSGVPHRNAVKAMTPGGFAFVPPQQCQAAFLDNWHHRGCRTGGERVKRPSSTTNARASSFQHLFISRSSRGD
jgi:putative tryptophan/tyrosine transport system substrate-binding protein